MQGHVVEVEDEKGMRSHISANVLISANGPLSAPKLPDIPGRGRFTGHSFHNLHWRKQSGDLRHKRIAVIGNGSSAVQFIPGLAALEGVEIKQYIRSGGYYFPKVNYQYSTLQKGAFRWIPGWRYLHRYLLFQAHNERWKARNEEDAAGHAETEKMLIDYLESVAPAEYVEDIRPHYRESSL
jgi:cation diffusion facilitator CzcD-associated flavoprotein CzcO